MQVLFVDQDRDEVWYMDKYLDVSPADIIPTPTPTT